MTTAHVDLVINRMLKGPYHTIIVDERPMNIQLAFVSRVKLTHSRADKFPWTLTYLESHQSRSMETIGPISLLFEDQYYAIVDDTVVLRPVGIPLIARQRLPQWVILYHDVIYSEKNLLIVVDCC
jgi:hypothetical protein